MSKYPKIKKELDLSNSHHNLHQMKIVKLQFLFGRALNVKRFNDSSFMVIGRFANGLAYCFNGPDKTGRRIRVAFKSLFIGFAFAGGPPIGASFFIKNQSDKPALC